MTTSAQSAHFNVNCLDQMLERPPTSYEWLRFDSNDNCNLHCVYCHNSRSRMTMELETFEQFLTNNVSSIANFQFGCRMEPTLDRRLVEFMELLARSEVAPTDSVALQTNGTLLHRHDGARMMDAGLTDIQLSIDTIDEESFAALRGGADVNKIVRNMTDFVARHPEVRVKFIVTVSKLNVESVEELVRFGIDLGVQHFIIREMFHTPGSGRIDDERMASIVLAPGRFARMAEELRASVGDQAHLNLIDAAGIRDYNRPVQAISYRPRSARTDA